MTCVLLSTVSKGSPARSKRSAETPVVAVAEFLQSDNELRESLREVKEGTIRDNKLNIILGLTLGCTFVLSVVIITSVALCVRVRMAFLLVDISEIMHNVLCNHFQKNGLMYPVVNVRIYKRYSTAIKIVIVWLPCVVYVRTWTISILTEFHFMQVNLSECSFQVQ